MRKTQTPAEALASRLYSVDAKLSLRLYEDPAWTQAQRHAIDLALTGIRNAEDKMTSAAYWVRSDMERLERAIAAEDSTYSAGIARNAGDYDTAAALREVHMASLAALLGEEEFAAWKAAKVAARTEQGGMHEHDGYAPHSHEIRPDHLGVKQEKS